MVIYHADGKGGYCKPDICSISNIDKTVLIIEVKTGGADLSTQQQVGFEPVGIDSKGEPMYRIPPDAIASGQ
ncbi:hypothetical protein [Agarivorans sp. Z349TD_8]|uniref:hypothetical protein n=1 Tax=Agarivorans sp. Z349TD_8 TaxID=3421434 RepID=UPI003D7E9746